MIHYQEGTKKEVKADNLDAVKIVRVEHGYAILDTWDDVKLWDANRRNRSGSSSVS